MAGRLACLPVQGHTPRPDVLAERWVIETRHAGAPWEVIVEPDAGAQKLVVVTAYPVEG